MLNNYYCRSKDFRQDYGRLAELRSLVRPGTPYMACTATATTRIYKEVVESLEMTNCMRVTHSPDRSNIFYEVKPRSRDIEDDLSGLLSTLKEKLIHTPRVIVYHQAAQSKVQGLSICTGPQIRIST